MLDLSRRQFCKLGAAAAASAAVPASLVEAIAKQLPSGPANRFKFDPNVQLRHAVRLAYHREWGREEVANALEILLNWMEKRLPRYALKKTRLMFAEADFGNEAGFAFTYHPEHRPKPFTREVRRVLAEATDWANRRKGGLW